jgi:membrane-associated phospholipid phosphatase
LHYSSLLNTVTDVADTAVMVPVALAISLQMYVTGFRRIALIVLLSLFLAAGAIGTLKVVIGGCDVIRTHVGMRSPSGHAALSAAVLLPTSALIASHFESWKRYLPLLAAALTIALITASRVLLGHHSGVEAVVGLIVGVSIGAPISWYILRLQPKALQVLPILVLVLIVTLSLIGTRAPSESFVHVLAGFVHRNVPFCS